MTSFKATSFKRPLKRSELTNKKQPRCLKKLNPEIWMKHIELNTNPTTDT